MTTLHIAPVTFQCSLNRDRVVIETTSRQESEEAEEIFKRSDWVRKILENSEGSRMEMTIHFSPFAESSSHRLQERIQSSLQQISECFEKIKKGKSYRSALPCLCRNLKKRGIGFSGEPIRFERSSGKKEQSATVLSSSSVVQCEGESKEEAEEILKKPKINKVVQGIFEALDPSFERSIKITILKDPSGRFGVEERMTRVLRRLFDFFTKSKSVASPEVCISQCIKDGRDVYGVCVALTGKYIDLSFSERGDGGTTVSKHKESSASSSSSSPAAAAPEPEPLVDPLFSSWGPPLFSTSTPSSSSSTSSKKHGRTDDVEPEQPQKTQAVEPLLSFSDQGIEKYLLEGNW